MTLNEAIKELRKHLGLTQQQFATELGMSTSGLQNYERAKAPQFKQLVALFAAAEKAGRPDLAGIMRTHVRSHVARSISENWLLLDVTPQDEFEALAVGEFLRCLRRPGAKALASQALASIAAARQLPPMNKERGLEALEFSEQQSRLSEEAIKRGFARIVNGQIVWKAYEPDIEVVISEGESERDTPLTMGLELASRAAPVSTANTKRQKRQGKSRRNRK